MLIVGKRKLPLINLILRGVRLIKCAGLTVISWISHRCEDKRDARRRMLCRFRWRRVVPMDSEVTYISSKDYFVHLAGRSVSITPPKVDSCDYLEIDAPEMEVECIAGSMGHSSGGGQTASTH